MSLGVAGPVGRGEAAPPPRNACATPVPAGRASTWPARTGSSSSPSSSVPSPSSTTNSSSSAPWQCGGQPSMPSGTRSWRSPVRTDPAALPRLRLAQRQSPSPPSSSATSARAATLAGRAPGSGQSIGPAARPARTGSAAPAPPRPLLQPRPGGSAGGSWSRCRSSGRRPAPRGPPALRAGCAPRRPPGGRSCRPRPPRTSRRPARAGPPRDRTWKISSSPPWAWGGVERIPGATGKRRRPDRAEPAACPAAAGRHRSRPPRRRASSTSSQCTGGGSRGDPLEQSARLLGERRRAFATGVGSAPSRTRPGR